MITLRVLMPAEVSNGDIVIFEDIVQPDVGPPRHIHHGQDETFFVEEGRFAFDVGGTRIEAGPGDLAFVPRGTAHAFRNIGSKIGRLRYAFTPALTIQQMFEEFHAASNGGTPNPDDMARIALDHGQEFVGPPLEA